MAIDKHVTALLTGQDSWNAFNSQGHEEAAYDFSRADLGALESFKGYQFAKPAIFSSARFRNLSVKASSFASWADFSDIQVEERAEISANRNDTNMNFSGSTFKGVVVVRGGGSTELKFTGAAFRDLLALSGDFHGQLDFSRTKFAESVKADGVQFHDTVAFTSAVHEGISFSISSSGFRGADFQGFRSRGIVDFSNSEFHKRTNFRGAVFEHAPLFHGAKLHQETQFSPPEEFDKQFPDVIIEPAESRYRTLKFHMIGQHAIAEQLAFGRLELKSRAKRRRIWWLSMFGVYEILSDYGMSWIRPLIWLAFGLSLEWSGLWYLTKPGISPADARLSALSIGNAVPYLGTLKAFGPAEMGDLFPPENVMGVELISVVFGIFSTVMLFLIALGIRNRLRLK